MWISVKSGKPVDISAVSGRWVSTGRIQEGRVCSEEWERQHSPQGGSSSLVVKLLTSDCIDATILLEYYYLPIVYKIFMLLLLVMGRNAR